VKLKFERFEGLCSFSIRGVILSTELKLLQVGIEKIAKELDSTLIVNLSLAVVSESLTPVLQAVKKSIQSPDPKIKIHWITSLKNLGDFGTLHAFTSRLTGFKHRQIGERLVLDDLVYRLLEKEQKLQAKVDELSGTEADAHALILKNRSLKEEERILRETVRFQKERMKHQVLIPSENEELGGKRSLVREELKKIYGGDLEL